MMQFSSWRRVRVGRTPMFALLLCGGVVMACSHTSPNTLPRDSQLEASRGMLVDSHPQDVREVLDRYCVVCHNEALYTGGIALDVLDVARPGDNPETWERVVRKLRGRAMPPGGMPRPDRATYDAVAEYLEAELDRAWASNPNPGRTNSVHRLTRTEYNNSVRDLFALDIDVRSLLPGDETADGSFDNNADVLSVTRAHLERYLSVARQVTRMATGFPPTSPDFESFDIPLHVVQDQRQSEDLPLGSRGGIAVRYNFPVDGEYLIKVRLQTNYAEFIRGMGWPQQIDIRLDGELMKRFTVGGEAPGTPAGRSYAGSGGAFHRPGWDEYMQGGADDPLEVRVPVEGGPHTVGVAFVRDMWEPEFVPQPVRRGIGMANDEMYMEHARVQGVLIGGPYQGAASAEDTPSRRAIFTCNPRLEAEEVACATKILSRMARRAYRRPATEEDVATLLEFFDEGRQYGESFDAGIQFALERMLLAPSFLVRVYRDPPEASGGQAYHLSDLEVASRLSSFLWSSIPDEVLLDVAENGRLTDTAILEGQVRRMLADPRATQALVNDFAAQWLNVRRVSELLPDPLVYPHFDESLLEAFQRETELFLASTVREDRSILDLLRADYTFVNERLARHYGISGVYGSRFRRVVLPNLEQRGGILGQGGLLALTSYPDRTSPVLRGKWLLDNVMGSPPPAPPANVDTSLEEDSDPAARPASIRERLERHRSEPLCASCHTIIDPLGFGLENFDAIGGWRTVDERGNPVDAVGRMPNGVEVEGLAEVREVLLDQPEKFVRTVTEKLMSYALGRRIEFYDQPAVRQIVRDAAANDYRWSSIILGIVKSPPFLMRASQEPA